MKSHSEWVRRSNSQIRRRKEEEEDDASVSWQQFDSGDEGVPKKTKNKENGNETGRKSPPGQTESIGINKYSSLHSSYARTTSDSIAIK